MTFTPYDSGISVFQITDVSPGTLRDISPYIISIGASLTRGLSEASGLGSTGRRWHPTLEEATFGLEVIWSDEALIGSDTVLGPLLQHVAAVAFDYGPEGKGTSNGDIKYYGNCWVRNYNMTTRVGNIVVATVEIIVDNGWTRGAYS